MKSQKKRCTCTVAHIAQRGNVGVPGVCWASSKGEIGNFVHATVVNHLTCIGVGDSMK